MRENVRPISSVPMNPPCPEAALSFVRTPDGIADFKCSEQAQAEYEKDERDESVNPGNGTELGTTAAIPEPWPDETERAEENDDAEAKRNCLSEAATLPDEVRHRDRNHRENARCEDGRETESKREREESGEAAFVGRYSFTAATASRSPWWY